MKAILLFLCLLALALPSRAATVNVIVPTRTSLTNNMLTIGTNGYVLMSTAIQVTNLTDLININNLTLSNLFATTIFLGGTNITNFFGSTGVSNIFQVFSGHYGGNLPTDVPTTSAAIAYDLDPPSTEYLWDGSIWY